MLYNAPRLPWADGYHASFDRSLRDDLPSGKIFFSLAEASGLIEIWRRYDHTARPRSERPRLSPTGAETAAVAMHQ
jgi:hypothetical protein